MSESSLIDTLDLMRDEFMRIRAIAAGDTRDEVRGLCDRAISGIEQHVPVIVQRDQWEARARKWSAAWRAVAHLAIDAVLEGDVLGSRSAEGLKLKKEIDDIISR